MIVNIKLAKAKKDVRPKLLWIYVSIVSLKFRTFNKVTKSLEESRGRNFYEVMSTFLPQSSNIRDNYVNTDDSTLKNKLICAFDDHITS